MVPEDLWEGDRRRAAVSQEPNQSQQTPNQLAAVQTGDWLHARHSSLRKHRWQSWCYVFLASLLHLLNIPRQLRSSVSRFFVPRTTLNLGKHAFPLATPKIQNHHFKIIWNNSCVLCKTEEIYILKFLFHLKSSVSLSLMMTFVCPCAWYMCSDSGLLHLGARVY